MIFFVTWMILGLIGQGLFLCRMKRQYGDSFEPFNRELIVAEIFIALIAGPVTFIALAIVFSDDDA